jgi:parallel beta-helix repeat protein
MLRHATWPFDFQGFLPISHLRRGITAAGNSVAAKSFRLSCRSGRTYLRQPSPPTVDTVLARRPSVMPTRRRELLYPGLLGVLAFVVVAADVASVRATDQPTVVARMPRAAFTLRENRTYDFGGRLVRCQPGQQVGIVAEGSGKVGVTNAVVEGCQVGVVTTGSGATVANVDVRDTSVCMLVAGRESTISSNQASHCGYGIVVIGNENTISDNHFNDNDADGILVTGDANLITGNEALRNRGVGLHVVRMVPMIADGSFLSLIQDLATGNTLQGNTAANNNVDLVEFGDCTIGLPNNWTDNHFGTKRPDCIQ